LQSARFGTQQVSASQKPFLHAAVTSTIRPSGQYPNVEHFAKMGAEDFSCRPSDVSAVAVFGADAALSAEAAVPGSSEVSAALFATLAMPMSGEFAFAANGG